MDMQAITNAVLITEGVLVVGGAIHRVITRRQFNQYIEEADERREFEAASRLLSAPDAQRQSTMDAGDTVK